MNGWQRMWVLVSLILGVGTAVLCYGSMQTEHELTEQYNAQLTVYEMVGNSIDRKEAGIKPLNIYDNPTHTRLEVAITLRTAAVKYRQELEALPETQRKHILTYAGIWLGICAGMYFLGSMLNWVYRGFRPKKTE